jgi:hypothetical protein
MTGTTKKQKASAYISQWSIFYASYWSASKWKTMIKLKTILFYLLHNHEWDVDWSRNDINLRIKNNPLQTFSHGTVEVPVRQEYAVWNNHHIQCYLCICYHQAVDRGNSIKIYTSWEYVDLPGAVQNKSNDTKKLSNILIH